MIFTLHRVDLQDDDYDLKLETERRIAARNLRALNRLASWVDYNRRKWTSLLSSFERLKIIFSAGPKTGEQMRWQQLMLIN
jgi:hypothetical protein